MSRVRGATPDTIEEAAQVLRRGGLVAFPTETVYGLGAVATRDAAVARIFQAKRRPDHNPLIAHVLDIASARPLVRWTEVGLALAERFWPGPLTLVLPAAAGSPVSRLVTAGLDTVAVRAPSAPVARALLEATLLPIAAPSANPSGRVSPTTAAHVVDGLGDAVDLVLDGGPCPVGLESTIVDASGPVPRMLRPGGLARAAIEAAVGPLADAIGGRIVAPGQLEAHYAPRCRVRLDATTAGAEEAFLDFGSRGSPAKLTLDLSPTGDLDEAARNLFAMLRALDRGEVSAIAVAPIPREGLGEAINDRLRRAAVRG